MMRTKVRVLNFDDFNLIEIIKTANNFKSDLWYVFRLNCFTSH